MALANLEYNHRKNNKEFEENRKFFNIENDIIPYVEHQWENLTSKHRPVKSNWHFTISKTLTKETDLFMVNPENASSFSLKERNLFSIGPMHVDVVQVPYIWAKSATFILYFQLYKRATATLNLQSSDLSLMDIDDSSESGIKTRGASKRRQTATTSDALANVTMQSVKRAKKLFPLLFIYFKFVDV
jgi:hypothetical protein